MGRHKSNKNLLGGSQSLRFEITKKGLLYYHFIKEMSVRDFAYGTAKSYYYGVCVPSPEAMVAISDILGIPLETIINWYAPLEK